MKLFLQQSNVIPFSYFDKRRRERQRKDNQVWRMMRQIKRAPEPMLWVIEVNPKEN